MKSLILTLVLLSATASFAREGHEGPEAAARVPSPIIAKVVTGSGFAPPVAPRATIVQIRANGVIERVRNFLGGKIEVVEVATLAPDVAKQVAATARKVKETDLIDPQPANPGCMDAPSTTYYAVQGRKEVVIAARENCKELEKVDESDADRDLKRALNGASALANIIR